ncbi:MAG: cupredoxin domain-containing protein [Actinomycetota bacterium]
MPQALRSKLLPLAFVLAVGAAACAEPPTPSVDIASGLGFLPEVADSLNDAGMYPSVVTNPDGLPVVAYFGFQETLEKGAVPVTRPVGAPSIPGVFLATVSDQGYWTRGAIAMAAEIPNVSIAFNPAFEPSVADLTPDNVTGLQMVADGDTYHAVWGSVDGIFYATGSLDPATTTQAQVTRVTKTPGVGPSIALVDGEPWIAFYTSTSSAATVQLATPNGDTWSDDTIADAAGCETCRTAVVAAPAGPVIAFSDGGNGVLVASNDGENGFVSFDVADNGGQGLSGVPTDGGLALSYYDAANGQVTIATRGGDGATDTAPAGEIAEGSADVVGAATSLAIGADGSTSVAWVDASKGVMFATGDPGSLEPIDTGTSTVDGAFPSITANEDGSVTYLAWYATEEQDLLVGGYGEFQDVPFAEPSPTPTGPVSTGAPSPTECTPVQGGTVAVVAQGVAFTEGDCIQATPGDAFSIEFDNKDTGTQHNIEVFSGSDPTGDTIFQGDILTGPDQATYDIPALDAGTYAFNCVVHPTVMIGEIQVGGAGGGGGQTGATGGGGAGQTGATGGGGGQGGGGGASTTTVTASGVAFDTSTIDLPAGEASTIHFVNQDSGVQHNIAIFPSADDLANPLFRGDLLTGPGETDYAIDPLQAGEYYFHCDVHPTMNGTVNVS